MVETAFAGIDVAFAKRKVLPICVARWVGNRLTPVDIQLPGIPPIPRGHGNLLALDAVAVDAFAHQTVAVLDALSQAA